MSKCFSRPNNRVKTAGALQGKKGKVGGKQIHPNSRRAKQLQRVELRSKKLEVQSRVQRSLEVQRVDRHLYFVHALPEDVTSISLPELHQILKDYINRNESELVELAAERANRTSWRKGEGKGKRETELEKLREDEESQYKVGFVLPDLTLPENVVLCKQWVRPAPSKSTKNAKGGDPSFLGRIRLIRIFSEDSNLVKVEREGARGEDWGTGQGEVEMEMGDDDNEDDEEPPALVAQE
ncbi:Tma16p [Sporobolomyces salmoneus]|uniref:Tma16p n=1 Tax=Sporobolomyces salmoneus TaxID=183962 RepID=UPI00317ADECD